MSARLDEVWHRLDHQAAWIGEREREAARDSLARFARWHDANPRRVLAAEHAFEIEVLAGGEPVVIRGSMDRVEIDAEGRVHVVDFKTGKRAATAAEIVQHAQLGVYQVAIDHGAAAGLGVEDVRSGGAELVHLRVPAGARRPDDPKVVAQPAPTGGPGGSEEPFFALDLLARSARAIRDEHVVARPGSACGYCDFQSVCPTLTGPTIGGPA